MSGVSWRPLGKPDAILSSGAELVFSGRTLQNVQVTERTTSGRSGLFQVSLPAGNYEVQSSANGFETAKTQVRIDQKMVPLQILLTPAVTRPTLYRFSLTVLEDLGRRPANARRRSATRKS